MSHLSNAEQVANLLRRHMQYDVMGRDDVIELVLVALFGDGHILLEDYPGSGKTTLAKALGNSIEVDSSSSLSSFRRLQFTPDLLPSDITGVMMFDVGSNCFQFRAGPVFSHVVLVDEINRTSPKVQSALLESMAEKQVTIDNHSYKLGELFFVIATQNPLDAVGTYPLPVAQLDRFMFKVKMHHISREAELDVIKSWGHPRESCQLPKVSVELILETRKVIRSSVRVTEGVMECLVDTVRRLREDKRCLQGASTRSLVQAIPALQSYAFLQGRDYVSPEDIKALSVPLFAHRLNLIPGVQEASEIVSSALEAPLEVFSRKTFR